MPISLRATDAADLVHFAECVERDPHHPELDEKERKRKIAEWVSPNTERTTWYDNDGRLFHVRVSRILRVEVQFDSELSPERARAGLKEFLLWLRATGAKAGFRELIYESTY